MNLMNMEYPKTLLKQCNNNNLLFEGLKKSNDVKMLFLWEMFQYAFILYYNATSSWVIKFLKKLIGF